jgi:hypothetical protein
MLVASSIRGNTAGAKPRGLSQVENPYVTRGRSYANVWGEKTVTFGRGVAKTAGMTLLA